MPEKLVEQTATSSNGYTQLVSIKVPDAFNELLFLVKENNVNAITYKIQGAEESDFSDAIDLEDEVGDTEFAVLKNGLSYQTLSDPWTHVRIMHKSTVGGAHGNTTGKILGGL